MANADVRKDAKPVPFTVLNVVLDSGERLPCLVDSATWTPVRVATRWAVRYRRYRVQASTLANNLRVLARVYLWAREYAGYDLDNHLTQGQTLRNREIESLASTLRVKVDGHGLDTGTFDQNLAVVEDFLKWSLDSENRGGCTALSLEQLKAERQRIEQICRSLRVGAHPSTRIEPLAETDIEAIRRAIGPRRDSDGHSSFPDVFSSHTRLRNWLMFEVALELGIRRGELLKLLITYRNFFHPQRAPFLPLVQPIVISHIADFLSGGGGTPSAFERFDIREPDGSFCKITSHQFRHWLNYIADWLLYKNSHKPLDLAILEVEFEEWFRDLFSVWI